MGAVVNGKMTSRCSLLHSAVTKGTVEIVNYLVEKDADLNGKMTNWCTILHSAVTKGTVELIK